MSSDLSTALKEFADNLAPSQSLVTEAGRIIDRLARYLHSNQFKWSHYINRVVPLGSYAKKSSLRIIMDLDVVIYLNDCHYPFKDFLSDLEDHIQLSESYTNCKLLGRGLLFVAEETLRVDLLPATNRVPRSEDSRSRSAQEAQYEETISYIRNSSNPSKEGNNQSTALSETAVKFVKVMNERFHCSTVARLAKSWSKTICIENFHYGRSSIMEYIAIRASELEQSTGREKTLNAFRRFLEEISNPEEIVIYWTEYYKDSDIQDRMKTSRPLLLDPTSPYNNMLRGKTDQLSSMATFAEVSLARLEKAEYRARHGKPIDLAALFKPQPEWVELPFRVRAGKKPGKFAVSVRAGSGLVMPKTVINSNMEEADQEIMENFLFSFTEVAVAVYKKRGMRKIAQKVLVDVQNTVAPDAGWGRSSSKLEIPFTDENETSKVLIVTFDILGDSASYL